MWTGIRNTRLFWTSQFGELTGGERCALWTAHGLDGDIHVGTFSLERANRALLARTGFEWIEVVELHGVEVGDLVDLVIRNTNERMSQQICRVWPGAVGVG